MWLSAHVTIKKMSSSPIERWTETWELQEEDVKRNHFKDVNESIVKERKEAFREIMHQFRERVQQTENDSTEDEEFLPPLDPEEENEEDSYDTQEDTPEMVSDESIE